ncbi:MAG: hypothetical protein ACOC9N_02810, partial [Gemmatimonadota bacterium]
MQINVHYGTDVFRAAVEPDERADRLLLKSLHHFDIETEIEGREPGWMLRPRGAARGTDRIVLDHAVGEQLDDGAELVLERDVA